MRNRPRKVVARGHKGSNVVDFVGSRDHKTYGERKLEKAVGGTKIRTGPVKPKGQLMTGKELADMYTRTFDP